MNAVVLETVQWSSLPDVDDVEPISDHDFAVLAEVGAVLRKHGYTNRLGLCLLHRHFEIGDDEIALEATDADARISTVTVEKRMPGDATNDRLQTMWRFRDSGEALMVTECVKVCDKNYGHKIVHERHGK